MIVISHCVIFPTKSPAIYEQTGTGVRICHNVIVEQSCQGWRWRLIRLLLRSELRLAEEGPQCAVTEHNLPPEPGARDLLEVLK